MKKIQIIVLLTCLIGFSAFSQTAREISEKSSNVIDFKSIEMASTLKIIDGKGRERVRKLITASREFDGVNKTILKFIAPADIKGTTLLIYDNETTDDDMWIYMPALRKTRRIVSSEKGKGFMGSEFTYADMGKPNMDDFDYKILRKEIYDGKQCWVIQSTCKNEDIEDENGFSRLESWIEKGTFLCHKTVSYDFDNELLRIQLIKDYQKQSGGGFFAFYMEKKNVQNGRKSIMTIDKFQQNCSLPESEFSPNLLGK
ncbi:MAG TPA: outer membrane lipoprotein-sorting protein [Bacteroidales bacterium]|nr:outer membrane lipoprotein-sorting protein [Bacteroidales bacterium]